MGTIFDHVSDKIKSMVVNAWKDMNESEKTHFINQVSLAFAIWGNDEVGEKAVAEVIERLVKDGSNNLCDFGLYVEKIYEKRELRAMLDKIKRAALIIEGYRIKNALPSEPTKELGV